MKDEWWKDPQWIGAIAALVGALTVLLWPLKWLYNFLVYRPRLNAEIRWLQPWVTPPKGRDLRCEVVVKNLGPWGAIVEEVIGFAIDNNGEKKKLSHKASSPSRFLTKDIPGFKDG